jgi:hypothetical protein
VYVTWTESIGCTYPEWVRLFRLAAKDASTRDESCGILNPRHVKVEEQSARSSVTVPIEDGRHVERRGPGWVIMDAEGSCLNEVERFVWSRAEPLFFGASRRGWFAPERTSLRRITTGNLRRTLPISESHELR